jgi:hypothetical protein
MKYRGMMDGWHGDEPEIEANNKKQSMRYADWYQHSGDLDREVVGSIPTGAAYCGE